jgi:cbb3-type cytochrome oxidase subunit 3
MVTILDYVFLAALLIIGVGICVAVWVYQRKQRQANSTELGASNDSQSNQ